MSLQTARPERAGVTPELRQRLRKRLADSPALGWLSPSLEELELDHCVLRLPYREEITNGSGTVHGGVLATLADSAVAFALATNFDGKMGFATTDLTIHFLRRARGEVWARARILKKGARVNVGEVQIVDASGRGGRPGARDVSADHLLVRLRPGKKPLIRKRHHDRRHRPVPGRRGGRDGSETLTPPARRLAQAQAPSGAGRGRAGDRADVSPVPGSCRPASERRRTWPRARRPGRGRAAARALHRLREHRARRPRRAVQEVRHPAGPPAADREGPHRLQEGLLRLDALLGVQAGVPRGGDRADRHPAAQLLRQELRGHPDGRGCHGPGLGRRGTSRPS